MVTKMAVDDWLEVRDGVYNYIKGETKMVLQPGEKYLRISLLGGAIKFNAYPNKRRLENPKAPHFKGDGVAVWVSKKREKTETKEYSDPFGE